MVQAFRNADTNKSGTLSKDEIRNMLMRLGQSTEDITTIIRRLSADEIDFEKFTSTVLLDSATGGRFSSWPHWSLHQKRACFERCVMHLRNVMGFAEMHMNRSLRGAVSGCETVVGHNCSRTLQGALLMSRFFEDLPTSHRRR